MKNKIIMPSFAQVDDEAVITKWLKKTGEYVKKGEILFEIETDKATLQIESLADGWLIEICTQENEAAASGATVAYISDKKEEINPLVQITEKEIKKVTKETDDYIPILKNSREQNTMTLIEATPKARMAAKESDIDIDQIYRKKNLPVFFSDIAHEKKSNPVIESDGYFIPTTKIRSIIAEKMKQSIINIPQYNVTVQIKTDKLTETRKILNKHSDGIKISYNDIIMKSVCKALKLYPLICSRYGEKEIYIHKKINFGFAADTPEGVIVPVIKNINELQILEIAKERIEILEHISKNEISPEAISGSVITLSNLGMYGVSNFTAILNPPESCIIAIGEIIETVCINDEKFISTHIMNLTATFDHRVIDGAYGSSFLRELKKILEEPELLIL